jgi:hypothetical protein
MKILEEITMLRPKMDCGAVYAFGEPESFKYPIAYVSEPGFWTMDESELKGIREYVAKGGFIIFDDFAGQHWYNFEDRWREHSRPPVAGPERPRFRHVYDVRTRSCFTRLAGSWRSGFYGAYENNDPTKRLVAIADYNNDPASTWNSPTRHTPIDLSTRRTRSW